MVNCIHDNTYYEMLKEVSRMMVQLPPKGRHDVVGVAAWKTWNNVARWIKALIDRGKNHNS